MKRTDSPISLNIPSYLLNVEESVIGGLLLDNSKYVEVKFLTPTDFYWQSHQEYFRVISQYLDKNQPIDFLILSKEFSHDVVGHVGTIVHHTIGSSLTKHYADIVLEQSKRRQLFNLSYQLMRDCGDRFIPVNDLVSQTRVQLDELVTSTTSFELITSEALEAMQFPPVRWIIPGLIPAGISLFAGAPKIGKSWLALDIALSVASGQTMFGNIAVDPGNVLYLALEDNLGRLQDRQRKLVQHQALPNLYYTVTWKRIDQGGLDQLREEINRLDLRVVIIDTLAMIRPIAKPYENVYSTDYAVGHALRKLTHELGMAMIVLHHTNKANPNDPFGRISGSNGLQGAFDNLYVLQGDENDEQIFTQTILHIKGRDVERQIIELQFHDFRWQMTQQRLPAKQMSPERLEVYEVIKAHGPIESREIAKNLNQDVEIERNSKEHERIKRLLTKLRLEGFIHNEKNGYVVMPNVDDALKQTG